MESFPLFFRIRAITFTIIILFSFLWLVLLCVEIFARWSMADQISHSLMLVFVLTNAITLISLPFLILVKFRVWLDAARLLLLFLLQVGSSAAGTYWDPQVQCPDQTPDDIGVCQLIGIYTMIACWIIPAILVLYSIYFAVVVYLQSRIPVVVEPERRSGIDPEMGSTGSLSLWRTMLKEIVGVQRSSISTNTSVPRRPLLLPTMTRTSQSSLLHSSTPQSPSTLPDTPQHQPTIPSLPSTSYQHLPALHSVPSRHHSLPAFRHDNAPHVRPSLTLPIPHPHDTNLLPSQTPSSSSYSTPSSANPHNPFYSPRHGAPDVQSHKDPNHRWRSKHLSMMHGSSSSSSPREMQDAQESPTTPTSSKRARLSKPLPAHFM